MAWYHGTYSCGHEGRINLIGPTKDREWKKEREFSGLCPECYKKKLEAQRKAENEASEKFRRRWSFQNFQVLQSRLHGPILFE